MRESTTTVTAIVLGIAAVLVVVIIVLGDRQEIGHPETYEYDPTAHDVGTAVVIAKSQSGGSEFLGIRWRAPQYSLTIAFTVPGQECASILAGMATEATWPLPQPGCSSSVQMNGRIGGFGLTADGNTQVSVVAEVDAACHGSVVVGSQWPQQAAECA